MSSCDFTDFDMNAYWLDSLDANPEKQLAGINDGIRIFRRSMPGDHLCDFLESGEGTIAVLNGTLFDAYAEQTRAEDVSRASLTAWIQAMTGAVFDKDNLFYAAQKSFREPLLPAGAVVRLLGESDAAAFEELDAACTPDDLEAGFVELDHDIVAGVFVGAKLVAKASAFAFFGEEAEDAGEDEAADEDGPVWDIGYVTRPEARGKGFGKSCCALITQELFKLGRIPQIRAEDKRLGSIGIAQALGYVKFGAWLYPEQEE